MRKKVYEISGKKNIQALLEKATVGRLATLGADGFPVITPLNYVWFRDAVYFHTALEGEKLENIRRDPRVCFEIDLPLSYMGLASGPARPSCEVTQFYQSVVIRGQAEIVSDALEKIDALNALMASHEKNSSFPPVKATDKAVELCHVVAVRPQYISAKANIGQKMSPENRALALSYLEASGDAAALATAAVLKATP